MGGFLDALRMAVPGVAAARTGYLQGQDQEADKQRATKRQGALDLLKQAMDQSTIDENHARADYYRNGGAGADAVQYIRGDDGEYYAVPKKLPRAGGTGAAAGTGTGASASGANGVSSAKPPRSSNDGGRAGDAEEGAAAAPPTTTKAPTSIGIATGVKAPPPKPAAAPRVAKAGVVNPASGMIEDVFSDGSRKEVRKATVSELEKAAHIPGAAGGASGGMKENVKEVYLQGIADRALQAAGGDVQKAEFAASNDPNGQKAYGLGLATRHFAAAKAKFDRQSAIDRDVHPATMDTAAASGPPPKAGAAAKPTAKPGATSKTTSILDTLKAAVTPNYPGAPKAAPTGNPIDLGENLPTTKPTAPSPVSAAADRAAAASATVAIAKSPRVQKAIDMLKAGKGTLDQLEKSANFDAREKAYILAAMKSGQPE